MRATNIFNWILVKSIFWLSLMMFTTSCLRGQNTSEIISKAGENTNTNSTFFTIHIFDNKNSTIPEGIDLRRRDDWKKLLTIDLENSDFVISEEDIESYDWSSQKITLENDIGKQYVIEQPQPPGFSFFVVAIDGTPISGGGILSQNSAVYADVPTLYVPDPIISESFEFYLRSTADLYIANPTFPVDDPSVSEKIRQHFWEANKLIE